MQAKQPVQVPLCQPSQQKGGFFPLNGKTLFDKMGLIQTQRIFMRKHQTAVVLSAALVFAGATAWGNVIVGGFAGTNGMERVADVVSPVLPVWREEAGSYVEISSTLTQTENGDASVVFRLLNADLPLTLAWQSGVPGMRLIAPGGLPENVETPGPGVPQTLAFRLQIRSLHKPAQRLTLETKQPNGSWLKVEDKILALHGLREWVEEDLGVVRIGVAGPVSTETQVRTMRAGSLLLVK